MFDDVMKFIIVYTIFMAVSISFAIFFVLLTKTQSIKESFEDPRVSDDIGIKSTVIAEMPCKEVTIDPL